MNVVTCSVAFFRKRNCHRNGRTANVFRFGELAVRIIAACWLFAATASFASCPAQERHTLLPEISTVLSRVIGSVVTVRNSGGAVGSGFVLHQPRLIVTNAHSVLGQDDLTITLPDGTKVAAELLSRHTEHDLALLAPRGEVSVPGLVLASAPLETGQWVIAVGNPFGLGIFASVGIIGALPGILEPSSSLADLIQTDAAINPGNSGGPLLNLDGEVVGVVSAAITAGRGIGFAVPASRLRQLLAEIDG